MTTLVALTAPQRSTQYSSLVDDLAPHEIALCPLHAKPAAIRSLELAGQRYVRIELDEHPDDHDLRELGMLATTSMFFRYYDRLGEHEGPFLQPLDTPFTAALPPDIIATRRYKGKTNELFTQFLCTVARASSDFAHEPWTALRVFDPLAGGGTTLFTAMVLGAEAAGVERNETDIESTVSFLKGYLKEQGIAHTFKAERLRQLGNRWQFSIGKATGRRLVLARGDTTQSPALVPGFKPHFVIADLPYGLQHHGEVEGLITNALPAWVSMVRSGGSVVFSWDATRFPRERMIERVEASSPVKVLNAPPYTSLAHRVDRVIKQRDVIVARPLLT